MAQIAIIVAMAENRVIGIENRLPWRLPADLRWFRQQTLGKPVVMGRRTFESIGRALPGRDNLVISRDPTYAAVGCRMAHSIDAALTRVATAPEVMIIGGASLYQQLLPRAHRLYLTTVHTEIEGDAWFPAIDPAQWQTREVHTVAADSENPIACTMQVLEWRNPS